MKKIYFILFTISLLIKLSYNSKEKGSYSLLDGILKKEIVEQSLLYLPKKNNVNLLEMLLQMVNVKDEYSLNDAESAYLAYQWITKNIKYVYSEESQDPVTVYNSGIGNVQGISSLFNRICQYLEIESGSILGYVKERNSKDFVHHWNYMVIDGSYYLVDATMGAAHQSLESNSYYADLYFGTYPEVFIRYHFPKESKWQLLSEPITREQFDSMAYLQTPFCVYGFKTISPDVSELNKDGTVVLTYDKSITDITIESWFYDNNLQTIEQVECNYGNGRAEIKYNLKNENAAYLYFKIKGSKSKYFSSFAYYIINRSSK